MENNEGKEEAVVVEDGAESEGEFQDAEQAPTLQISMHALGYTSTASTTFTLKIQISLLTATALVNSGRDASFINAKFAMKAQCSIATVPVIQVAAASGSSMRSTSLAYNALYYIGTSILF
jgi:hypothetical protein